MAHDKHRDDHVQHGLDDNPSNDPKKGATLGGLGGAAVGAAAGAAAGPVGAVIGAVVGGISGAVASGAAVAAVDRIDNDNTVTGLGHGATTDVEDDLDENADVHAGRPVVRAGSAYDLPVGTAVAATAHPGATGVRSSAATGEVHVPVTEETADVQKVQREVGQVGVRKEVDEVTQHVAVPVERTRVIVEERDLGTGTEHAAASRAVHEGQVLSVPVTEEELVVQKVPHTREMIIRTEKETELVEQDVTLRKERAEVVEDGDVEVDGPRTVGSSPKA